ncbi:hypothetical protein KSP40_PGU019048 [Platanthera guangdongensis]|uniref:ATPase family AAA domain-containing protein n=1 Tax=Platanthera guangdongensis TaxID=2320717 RepID=A0ABR2N1I9_9ASPA
MYTRVCVCVNKPTWHCNYPCYFSELCPKFQYPRPLSSLFQLEKPTHTGRLVTESISSSASMPPLRAFPFSPAAVIAAATAAAASFAALAELSYADNTFRFPYLSSPSLHAADNSASSSSSQSSSSSGFDPESLERGAKALREINSSSYAKQVFELMRKQEETRLEEIAVDKAKHLAILSEADIVSALCFVDALILEAGSRLERGSTRGDGLGEEGGGRCSREHRPVGAPSIVAGKPLMACWTASQVAELRCSWPSFGQRVMELLGEFAPSVGQVRSIFV